MSQIDTAPIKAESHALSALGWLLADDMRARRLLDVTGLTPEGLRSGIGERQVQAAVLAFLEGHEPDLLLCADALGMKPQVLVAARRTLEADDGRRS